MGALHHIGFLGASMTHLVEQVAAPPLQDYTPFSSTIRRANDGPAPIPVEVRFWNKVEKSEAPDECWMWMGSSGSIAYFRDGKEIREEAHRISWRIHFGGIPTHLKV